MPLLYALGQHKALQAIHGRLQDGERLFAFLGDLYVTSQLARTTDIYGILEDELWRHARIRINAGRRRSGTAEGLRLTAWHLSAKGRGEAETI